MKVFESINPQLTAWIGAQRLFFVSTAPSSLQGHVNVSPKGGDSFRILGPLEVVYQDYTGSGAETAAHLRKIVRLYGQGTVVAAPDDRFQEFTNLFPPNPGTRAFIHIVVSRVSDSCGYSVPLYDFREEREGLNRWAAGKGPAGLEDYRAQNNERSIDGLPAFDLPPPSPDLEPEPLSRQVGQKP